MYSRGAKQPKAFKEPKNALTSPEVQVHYDPTRQLRLPCDATLHGIGVVLSYKLDDGTEHPIAFASHSLSPAERKYAQLGKEGLTIIFGVKNFS